MTSTYLQKEREDGVVRLTLNRPKHNMLNIEMMKELNGELEALMEDREATCLVFLGEGPSWCAGVEVADHQPEVVDDMMAAFNRLFELLDGLEVPIIAAVHGACLGGGLELALACDMIISKQSAFFGQPEIKLGFFPPYAAIRLPHLVGYAKAVEICLTGKRYTAEEARTMGFVSQVLPDDAFTEGLEKLLGEIKNSSPLIIRLNKRVIKQNLALSFDKALQNAGDLFLTRLMKTEDTQEGMKSYFERRRPVWKNR